MSQRNDPARETDRSGPSRRTAARGRERGIAMLWALFATMVVAGLIVSGTDTFIAVDKMGGAEFSADGQARSVADAGLIDALAWFRRQQTQPVTTFAPVRNLSAVPPINETDNASIGLVREYEIFPSLWGRYEVRKGIAAEAFTDTNGNGRYNYGESYTDSNGNGRRDPARETVDASADRGFAGNGTVWRIVSRGSVYRRQDAGQALGAGPNTRLATTTVVGEVRRLTIVAPTTAAICSRTGSSITIGSRGRVLGGTKTGVFYSKSTGTPKFLSGSEVKGTPASAASSSTYKDDIQTVFGVSLPELKAMADASYATPASFPAPIGDFTLNVVTGPITFDLARPIRGTGVVVVIGDCTVAAGSNAFFNGVLYVQGKLTIRGPVYFRGTVVVTGAVDIAGSGADYSELNYDGRIISQVLTILGQYRFSTSAYEEIPVLPDGTPDEDNLIKLQKTGLTLPGGNLPNDLGNSLPSGG